MTIVFKGWGAHVPGEPISSTELMERYPIGLSPEWIVDVTGIKNRHWAAAELASSDLAYEASKQALKQAKLQAADLDHIILATSTPDYVGLPGACNVLKKLGANCPAVDMIAACAGSIHAMNYAIALIRSGEAENVLMVAADCKSRFVDKTDETYLHIFGDGAGALILGKANAPTNSEATANPTVARAQTKQGVQSILLRADGQFYGSFKVPAGGSAIPASKTTVAESKHFIQATIEGKMVAKHAINLFAEVTLQACEKARIQLAEIDYIIPHQPNLYILRKLAEALDYPLEKFVINIDKYGNTGAAAMPIGVVDLFNSGKLAPGNTILLLSAGSGVTAGALIYKS